ncbi:MAG: hypothetical protein WDN69_21000 [Aliidongia sp.]
MKAFSLPVDEVYYYFHIPKCGGTLMTQHVLPTFFRPEQICPIYDLGELVKLDRAELDRFTLFRGHYYKYLANFVRKRIRALTVLRHPFERAISTYRYILEQETHPLHDATKRVGSFEAFLSERDVFCPDSMTVALGVDVDPSAVLAAAEYRSGPSVPMQRLFDEEIFVPRARACHLAAAKRTLDDCVVVGLQEEMEKTVSLIFDHFGGTPTGPLVRANATERGHFSRADLPSRVLDTLFETHRYDLEAYAYGKALFERRWRDFTASPSAGTPEQPKHLTVFPVAPTLPGKSLFLLPPDRAAGAFGRHVVEGYFRPSELCPLTDDETLAALPAQKLAGFAAFIGPQAGKMPAILAEAQNIFALLRDPVASVVLHYRSILADPGHPQHEAVRGYGSFLDFIRDRRAYTADALTLFLSDSAETVSTASAEDFRRAKAMLSRFGFIGFCDRIDDALKDLAQLLDWPQIAQAIPPAVAAAAAKVPAVSWDEAAAIRTANPFDAALYQYARRLVRWRAMNRRLTFRRLLPVR